jgi:hypothetical protein
MAVRDVAHVEWNAGAGTKLDRLRTIAAALTGALIGGGP